MAPPIDFPTFYHTAEFDEDWDRLGLSDEDLAKLQLTLAADPTAGRVVAGTGGLRKLRFSLPGRGKSGGVRVGYAQFPDRLILLLVTVYGKSDQADLSSDQKKAIAVLLRTFEERLPPEA